MRQANKSELLPLASARIGSAGWTIRSELSSFFPERGTHLERYAQVLTAVEINSSFYRPHRAATYARWAASTPEAFHFAVKAPKSVTHDARLRDVESELASFLDEVRQLGPKLGPILFQFPKSFSFDEAAFQSAFAFVRSQFDGAIVYEPRHSSWFEPGALSCAISFALSLVQADPSPVRNNAWHLDDSSLLYLRLHGSPRMYYSPYSSTFLVAVAERLKKATERGVDAWCIFDNTAAGAAMPNAFELERLLRQNHEFCASNV